jgi:DNA modification methylase
MELPETDNAVDAEAQIDKAEELRVKWGVETGQLWQLGDHRLLCGDSTKAEDVERCLGGVVPLLMVTDPPYGVEYDAGWRSEAMPTKNDKGRWTTKDGRAKGAVLNDDRADWREAWVLFPGDVAYVWHAGNMAHIVAVSLMSADLQIRAQIIWAKNQLVIGRGDYHPQHEPCWYCVRSGKPGLRTDDRKQTTLWQIDKPKKSETGHSTQKPIECMARPIRNHNSEYVYEPFSGSGTTLIACEQLGRKCRAIEIHPPYVAVALQRWADATGKTPVLI